MQVYKYFCQTWWSIWSLPQAAALTHHFPACGECCLVGSGTPVPAAVALGLSWWGVAEEHRRTPLSLTLTLRARWMCGQPTSEIWDGGFIHGGSRGFPWRFPSGRCGADRLFPWPGIHGRRLQLNCQHGKTVSVLKSTLQRRSLYLMLQPP